MKVFVTGGSGLVGSTVIDLLLANGNEVVAIDNFATGRRDNLEPHPRLQLIEDTIVHPRVVSGLFGDFRPDVVIHTAASYKDPDDWQADALTNCVGSANVARACKDHKVGRLIYFQTALCYGTKPLEQPITLNHPLNPVNSSYAISKAAGENYIQPLGPDDAPTILLDPSRTFRDFGEVAFTPFDEIVTQTVAYYREFGVQGGYTHLRTETNS